MKPGYFIHRFAEQTLARLGKGFPIVGITGPRQSGKTTLAKKFFAHKPYISLEDPDQLDFAQSDPRRFLDQFADKGAVLDEIQRCPQLFSYLQTLVDTHEQMGEFVLTGSQQFGLRAHIAQTLAGRIGTVHLLPFSIDELAMSHDATLPSLDELFIKGLYPPVYARPVEPIDWYGNYVQTYLERDVLQLIKIKDLNTFRLFLRLCAGRAGQLINYSDLGNDAGVSHNTIKEWLSVLEASYIIHRLPPYHNNYSKRLIKTPKLYFYDTGLLCWLLNIKHSEQVIIHSMRGAIFENLIISEIIKYTNALGISANIYFWRDKSGLEVDVILEHSQKTIAVEIKSGATINHSYFKNLDKFKMISAVQGEDTYLIYGGDTDQQRANAKIISWRNVSRFLEQIV